MNTHSAVSWLVLLSLVLVANAQNTTAAIPSVPELKVGWQAGPTERGTLTLVYSCLITVFACTWTVLHLNVPGLYDGPWTKALRKAKWMAITVLFPEFILSKAICDLRLALNDLREFDMELKKKYDDLKWTVSSDPGDVEHTWSWKVNYGPRPSLLYRILGLPQPPVARKRKAAEETVEPEDNNQTTRRFSDVEDGGSSRHTPQKHTEFDHPETRSAQGSQVSARDENNNSVQSENPIGIEQAVPPSDVGGSVATSAEENAQEEEAEEEDRSDSSLNLMRWGVKSGDQNQPKVPHCKYHTTQYWTPTHSYFANMGGLLHPEQFVLVRGNSPRYYALTGAKLSSRFYWDSDHPLRGLVLDKQDIEDKSKADWLLKSLAVLQITWLILTVLVRGVTGLPVTQLEIAALAFSIFAIATYAANWWKPKDVSRPTRLQTLASGRAKRNGFDRTQEFILRLRAPAKAAGMAQRIRVEGNVPFIFSIMAVSALVFGGLHCLAWNFEFPSRAELILWRTASLTSAILPVISLASSLALNYVATTYTDHVLISSLMHKLKPLNSFPAEFWESLKKPIFNSWGWDGVIVLISIPTGSRNFEEEPPKELHEQLKKDGTLDKYTKICIDMFNFSINLMDFIKFWERAKGGGRDAFLLRDWVRRFTGMEHHSSEEMLEFWGDFENYLKSKFRTPDTTIPEIRCAHHILSVKEQFKKDEKRIEKWRKDCGQASQFLTISSGIVYAASRLIILVLLFTCLRAVPEGVYENTPWTRFLPNIS
ncbi:uncharacterized protein PAC_13415 [Phialocephala subalpina]|uniref:Uncharacterized protein n=1 Tax=Phialocephala subalpina TaxID=576137 RepID=A0A1L7XES6_9HELO|nr:uncharacterized protein PAC_13415 [Phialocephala subalpina]